MVTEGDVATWFFDAVRSALERQCPEATICECYVTSQSERFSPDRLHAIPANRRYGVWVHAVCKSEDYRFFWDSLEESASLIDIKGKEQMVHCSRFQSMPEFPDRIRTAVDALVRDTIAT